MLTRNQIYKAIEKSPGFPVFRHENQILLQQFYDNPTMKIDTMIELVETNEELSRVLLATVNSPLLGRTNSVGSVKEAVILLGSESVCNIAIQQFILKFFPAKRLPGQHFDIAVFWNHLAAVALMASEIGRITYQEDSFRLFTYGLLHDIGFIVVDACLPDLMDQIEEKYTQGVHHLVAEKTTLSGLTHNDIGAWICNKWNLNDSFKKIAKFHHFPHKCHPLDDDLRIIYISEIIGGRYYESILGATPQPIKMDMRIVKELGLTMEQLDELENQLPQMVEKFLQPYLLTYDASRN